MHRVNGRICPCRRGSRRWAHRNTAYENVKETIDGRTRYRFAWISRVKSWDASARARARVYDAVMNENAIYGHRRVLFVSITIYLFRHKCKNRIHTLSARFQQVFNARTWSVRLTAHISNHQQIQLLFVLSYYFLSSAAVASDRIGGSSPNINHV